MSDVQLKAGGHIYTGWKSATITRSMETLAASFSLSLSENFTNNSRSLPISFDESVQILIDNDVVITGFVDEISTSYNESSHDYSITGRSRAGDLIDCTAIYKTGEFLEQTLDEIATVLCADFNINVDVDVDTGAPFPRFRTDDATVFDCLQRGARQRGLLLISDAQGNVIFTKPGSKKIQTPLTQGAEGNIKSGSGSSSMNSRYSKVIVKGTAESSEFTTDEQSTEPTATAFDKNVTRYRPLVVQAESQGSEQTLNERALFEVSTRLGRSSQINYQVAEWRHRDGLWLPNQLVKVVDKIMNIDKWMLISTVTFTKSESGTTTSLTVMPPEAFKTIAESEYIEVPGSVFLDD